MGNKEITARSDSPLTHYVDIVLEQIDLLDDARRGVFLTEGVTDICGLLARFGDDHKRLGRLALQEMRDDQATDKERELLLDSIDKHAICLETAYQNTQGYITRDIKDEAYGKSVAAVGELCYLTKPTDKPSGSGQAGKKTAKAGNSVDNANKTDLLIAAITKWHKYEFDKCENYEPISVTDLANQAGVSKATASKFFTDHFGGHLNYKARCRAKKLSSVLGPLNRETPARVKKHEQGIDWQS